MLSDKKDKREIKIKTLSNFKFFFLIKVSEEKYYEG